jgi:hypothetical protein
MGYHTLNNSSSADESLFGGGQRSMSNAGRTVISGDELRTLKSGGRHNNATFISNNDFARIRQSAVIKSAEVLRQEADVQEQQNAVKQDKARQRKAMMAQKAEMAKQKAPRSDVEMLAEAERQALLESASVQRDEQLDSVKLLNTLGARAAAFTIREQQLKELEERRSREKEYDDRMNKMMELDRLKDLMQREVVEDAKLRKRLSDKDVLMEQIEGRRREKLRADEQVEIEKGQVLEKIRQNEALEQQKAEAKSLFVQRSIMEVKKANQKALGMKQKSLAMERMEEEKILAYQRAKAESEQRREEEEAEKAHAAELATAKLRAQQEKMMDNQSALDELRAKRASEEKERKARNEEIRAEEKRRAQLEIMEQARVTQAEFKRLQRAKEVLRQKQEYENILRQAKVAGDRERIEAKVQQDGRYEHKDKILTQIAQKEHIRTANMGATRDEGKGVKMDFAVERAKLERIRKEYVNRLEKEGVNPKYLTEMKRADMAKLQMR